MPRSSTHPRGRTRQAEYTAKRIARNPGLDRSPAKDGARKTLAADEGRSRLDRHEGDREGQNATLRNCQWLCERYRALSRWGPRRGKPAVENVSLGQARQEASLGVGNRRCVRSDTRRCNRDQRRPRSVGQSRARQSFEGRKHRQGTEESRPRARANRNSRASSRRNGRKGGQGSTSASNRP